ncbi:hypothetical protein GCM10010182_00810 [Actinomadura cremea]|nr:hypothetical protein GCM10010182_00810 [Actinomadura cremea]
MSDVSTALADAMNAPRGEELISSVKNIVIAELEKLDPNIRIKTTDYFNHSFIPDIVLNWKEAGKSASRDVFLRTTFRSARIGRDVPALAELGPVVLALQGNVDDRTLDEVTQEVEDAPRLLLTNVPALDSIVGAEEDYTGVAITEQVGAADAPLLNLFRSNVMRGGRGIIAEGTASRIRDQIRPARDLDEEIRNVDSFTGLVDDLFLSDAAARLTRASQILRMGLSGDISLLSQSDLDDDPESLLGAAVRGRLSDAELRVLIPYLLRRRDVTTSPTFWAHIGSMMSLERLESMWSSFLGLDLTPLVKANLDSWSARRASLEINADVIDVDSDTNHEGWSMHARMLCLTIGAWRLHLAVDGRKTRNRGNDKPSARWDELQRVVSDYPILSVTLQGLARRLNISAESSSDVYRDIEMITDAVEDNYYVPALEMRPSNRDDAPKIVVDFGKMVATADAPANLRDLGLIGLNVLGHRQQVELGEDDLI